MRFFRDAFWETEPDAPCYSQKFRHGVCLLGVEGISRLRKFPQIIVNKMMPEFDFGAITCWFEYMFNRSHLDPPKSSRINPMFYLELPHVRYQYERLKTNDKVDKKRFDCNFHGAIDLT